MYDMTKGGVDILNYTNQTMDRWIDISKHVLGIDAEKILKDQTAFQQEKD